MSLPLPGKAPVNKLSLAERTRVLEVLDSEEFVDQAPLQVYATLLERGVYLCSVSTMYRILAPAGQVTERRRLARHPARAVPELVATGPGQVSTWDITNLPGPDRGVYYDAYVMIDIYSRYIVGAHVHAHEAGVLAEEMMKGITGSQPALIPRSSRCPTTPGSTSPPRPRLPGTRWPHPA